MAVPVLQPKPKPCSLGYYYNFTTEECTICPAGTWESNTFSTGCNPCKPGYFSSTEGKLKEHGGLSICSCVLAAALCSMPDA